jgi:putative addiction module component (TIGR02574 family)
VNEKTLGTSIVIRYDPSIMATRELYAQAARLPVEERRFLAEIIWETVDADLPALWENDATLADEVERRFEAFKSGRDRGLSHAEVFSSAKALVA